MNNLVESIAVKNGEILNQEWHEKRYMASYAEYFGKKPKKLLLEDLDLVIPDNAYYKLRIEYSENEKIVALQPYVIKPIESLKIIEHNSIDYHLKSVNRTLLNQLYAQRGNSDDILIVKNGLVTDTSAGNILFYDDKQWFTPNAPLLKGTQRARLLAIGKIKERTIRVCDIQNYEGFQVINAMRPMIEQYNPIHTIIR